MTLLLNFRSSNTNGVVVSAREALELANPDGPLSFNVVPFAQFSQRAAGRNVLFATHGFNVNQEDGARSLARLEQSIQPLGSELFVGVLWPGDWWIPAVNYPFAGNPAMASGRELAKIADMWLKDAASLSYVSHSLGARVILEAAQSAGRPPRSVCLMAAAVNRDCLATEYLRAQQRTDGISNLASAKDRVLQLAFPVGDLFADLLHHDHELFKAALGRNGPARPIPSNTQPSQIADLDDFDHGDYLPPSGAAPLPAPQPGHPTKYGEVADFVAHAFRRQSQPWP